VVTLGRLWLEWRERGREDFLQRMAAQDEACGFPNDPPVTLRTEFSRVVVLLQRP
jgi:hypothetical protein